MPRSEGMEWSWMWAIRDLDMSFMLNSLPNSLTRFWASLWWVPNQRHCIDVLLAVWALPGIHAAMTPSPWSLPGTLDRCCSLTACLYLGRCRYAPPPFTMSQAWRKCHAWTGLVSRLVPDADADLVKASAPSDVTYVAPSRRRACGEDVGNW